MKDLRLTLLQVPLAWENKKENLRFLTQKINSLEAPSDIIVLPEMFSTGFSMNSNLLAEKMDGPAVNWMHEQSANSGSVICGSLIIEENGNYFNRLVWMLPDGKFRTYDKRHLFRMAKENEYYSGGKKKVIVEHEGWKICLQVCYDLRFPVWSRRTVQDNYDVLLYTANWPERRSFAWKSLLVARAIENQSYVIGLNRIGKDGNDILYTGDSVVLDFVGQEVANAEPGSEASITAALSMDELKNFRKNFPAELDADEFTIRGLD